MADKWLPMAISEPTSALSQPLYVLTSVDATLADGFDEEERDGADRFHWMAQRGLITFAPNVDPRSLEIWIFAEFHDLSQRVIVSAAGRTEELPVPASSASGGRSSPRRRRRQVSASTFTAPAT